MKLAIIGSGVIGQATGIGFIEHGHQVIFHDIDHEKLLDLKMKGYNTTSDVQEALQTSEAAFICVPTPTVEKKIDVKYLLDSAKSVGEALRNSIDYHVVIFRSTAPPQTTRLNLLPVVEKYSGKKAGLDFGLCMNPEFLREKTALSDFLNPDRVVIGEFDKKSGDIVEAAYCSFSCPIIRISLDEAEMVKYASNLFLASKISFFNEIYMICKELGIDSKRVSETVSLDKRIGKYGVYGGQPFSGMCFPKDLAAFITFAKSQGINPKLLEAVEEINRQITDYSKK